MERNARREFTTAGRIAAAVLLVALAALVRVDAAPLQGAPNRPRQGGAGALADPGVSPAEIQRLFDAYVVMQAQQALELTDEQYPKFLTRVKTLQDARRRHQTERTRLVQELRRLTQTSSGDETRLRDLLRQVNDLDARAVTEVRTALDGIDQVLDVRQQARFRVFEDQMERRKVELLLRARQANRQRNNQTPP